MSSSLNTLVTLSIITVLSAPVLALALAFLVWLSKRPQQVELRARVLGWSTRLLSGVSLVGSLVLATRLAEFPFEFSLLVIHFYLDALSVYFVLLVNLVAFFASWYTVEFLQHDALFRKDHEPEVFHIFFNAFHVTMLVVPMVDNLVILWMAIELTTLVSTLLVRYRRRRTAVEAAWKYIIITTAGIIFALFGTLFLADAINDSSCSAIAAALRRPEATCDQLSDVDLMRWSLLGHKAVAEGLNQELVVLSFLFVLVGYGTKAGFAPMHTWLPDGHGEAPSPVSALLSGVLLKSALYAILRFYTITNLNQGNTALTSTILLFLGLFSLVLATPFILKGNKFKRVLAYHSLEHMGIIAFGIGIGGPLALFGALLHALNHALTKALMFLTFGHVRREYAEQVEAVELEDKHITGVLKSMPLSAIVLLLGGLGLVGSPPFNIFFSEFIILWAAFGRIVGPTPGQLSISAYIVAVALFLITVTIIFGGLVGHLARLLLDRPEPAFVGACDHRRQLLPLVVLLAVILLFGVWIPTAPIDFPQLLNQSVCILQNGAGVACLK
jgi:hydrogenase-4 component F